MHQLFTADDRPWPRRLLGVGVVGGFVLRFLVGSLNGVLLLSVGLYVALPHLTGIEPWNFQQLLLWFDELGNDAKVGLGSSLVTVLGFFIAVHTTMHSWQRQTAATMRMAAADEIDRTFGQILEVLLQIALFTEASANEVERVRKDGVPLSEAPKLTILFEDLDEFRANRLKLRSLEQDVLALPARYTVLFLPIPGVPTALDAVGSHLASVTARVGVRLPAYGVAHPEHRRYFLEGVDPKKFKELSEVCERARDKIAGVKGYVRGALLSPVLEANAVSFARLVQQLFRKPNTTEPNP